MVNVNKLKARIVEKGLTQEVVMTEMGLTKRMWYDRMVKRKFDSDEIYSLIKILDIDDPTPIFLRMMLRNT